MADTTIRIRIAKPLKPLEKIKFPSLEEFGIVRDRGVDLMRRNDGAPIILSVDEETGEFILTPDPHKLLLSDPIETSNRVAGFPLTAMVNENDPFPKNSRVWDGLDRSKVVFE